MSQDIITILVLAAIAMVVLTRLYSVLGRRVGSERPLEPPARPRAAGPVSLAPAPSVPAPSGAAPPAASGMTDILRADPAFDPSHFLAGARKAYELIVGAFAAGDRDALRPLLTPGVFTAYERAVSEREARGGKGPELVRLKTAELGDGGLDGTTAHIDVRFEAELAEGAHGLRETKERWTFERDTTSSNPNWRLAAVAQA